MLAAGATRVVGMALVALGGGALLPGQLADSPSPREFFGPTPPEEKIPPVIVHVFEYGFEPSRVIIKTGQGIVWRNIGKELHNIAPRSLSGETVWKAAQRRGTTRHVFTKPGTYPYFCTLHTQMRGRVVVRARV